MKIVILDGYTLNPGDLSWDGLKEFGELEIHDRTAPDDVLARAGDAEIILTNKTPVSGDVIKKLPGLKYIGVLATGYNIIDIGAAKEHGVVVTNVPGYGTASVVQLTFALILELCLRVQRHSDSVYEGKWSRSADFCYWDYPLIELAGKTLGIIGFGSIGQHVADLGSAFGMNIIASSRTQTDQSSRANFRWVDIPGLFAQADIVSLHCPLTDDTRGIVSIDNLSRMKPSSFLINTSRGPLIVEQDLADALNTGMIAGAGLDVLSVEPPAPDNPLLKAQNCIITPHIAWASFDARKRLLQGVVDNLGAFLKGNPKNKVN